MSNLFHTLKLTFIVLGLASGMTAAALFYFHNVPKCQAMVLSDLATYQQFTAELAQFTDTADFLTTLQRANGKR